MSEKKSSKSYEQAFQELQDILQKIEAGDIGIDKISSEVKHANKLLKYCQDKLRNLEVELDKYFEPE